MIREGADLYRLDENFRSTPEIVAAAQGFIGKNFGRFDVPQRATRESGAPVNLIKAAGTERRDVNTLINQIEVGRETAILTRTQRERDRLQAWGNKR